MKDYEAHLRLFMTDEAKDWADLHAARSIKQDAHSALKKARRGHKDTPEIWADEKKAFDIARKAYKEADKHVSFTINK